MRALPSGVSRHKEPWHGQPQRLGSPKPSTAPGQPQSRGIRTVPSAGWGREGRSDPRAAPAAPRPPLAPWTRPRVWQELVNSSPLAGRATPPSHGFLCPRCCLINDGKELKRRGGKKKKSEGEGRGAGQQLSARQVARQGVIKILG